MFALCLASCARRDQVFARTEKGFEHLSVEEIQHLSIKDVVYEYLFIESHFSLDMK